IEHCTSEHQEMITAAGAEDLIRRDGWIEMHRDEDKLKTASVGAESSQQQGIEHKVLSIVLLKELEPNGNFDHFIGDSDWSNSWHVSKPGDLVKAYVKSFQSMNGTIGESTVKEIRLDGDGWKVITDQETFYSDEVVIAAGPWSNQLIKPLGYDLPLFPMRGYHQHFETTEKNKIY